MIAAARRAKIVTARLLTSRVVGCAIKRIFRNGLKRHGCVYFVADGAVSPRMAAALFWGLYERSEIRLLRRIRLDCHLVELGASIGVRSGVVCHGLGPAARLICAEPNPALLPLLHRHVRANGGD